MAKKFTIQIEVRAVVSTTIKAESIAQALEAAELYAMGNSFEIIKPIKGWAGEYEIEGEVVAVLS